MRITRLLLRNYRVYEDQLEIELPPGLVGVYGVNGAGKSVLLESILFALWGKARTSFDQIRTSGVNGECVAEVEFEHEGHLYLVRRTISGINNTVKAQAHADGLHVAEGVRDTGRYVRSVLGMDDAAFRASVFAEQKQVAAFSAKTPAERKKLVLQLLGITPLDGARDQARRDARTAQQQHEKLRGALPDVEERRAALTAAQAAAAEAAEAASLAATAEAAALETLTQAQAGHAALDTLEREHRALVAEGRAVRAEHDAAERRVAELTTELDALEVAGTELAELRPQAEGLAAAEARLRLLEALAAAETRLAAAPVVAPPAEPDEDGCRAARTAADDAAAVLAEVRGRRQAAEAELARTREAVERSAGLSGEADCPLCGQALGDAFEQVQAHRAGEVAAAEARLAALDAELAERATAAKATAEAAEQAATSLDAARAAQAAHRAAAERRTALEAEVAEVAVKLVPPAAPGEADALTAEVARRREAAAACERLAGRLQRRDQAAKDLETERARLGDTTGRLEALREKVKALGFKQEALDAAIAALRTATATLDEARERARAADRAGERAGSMAEAAAKALADAEEQHAKLVELAEESRHLGRVADLLGGFRNELVGSVGPRLSAQAASLFGELTDREYDELRVDPETYEVRIVDGGHEYGMDRFSGSETDLANLALRVAISEQVRFQSGGQVGLLVLDEVFGPLDDDRKERMLLALERLRARFRQVLVVTHDTAIKEQLPNALEVVKLPGRRATARLLTG